MPRLGVITDEISEDFDHALSVCNELGIRDIELRSLWKKSIIDHDSETIGEVATSLSDGGFSAVAIASPFLKCHIHGDAPAAGRTHSARAVTRDDQWDVLERSFEVADRLGAEIVRTFSFWRVEHPESVRDEVLEVLQEATERTRAAGKLLGLENEHACNVATGEESAWILERIPDRTLGLIWDPGNEAALGSVPYPNGYELIKDRIHHVHLKDAKEISHGTSFTTMGKGAIAYEEQFRALANDGYAGVLSLETHYRVDGDAERATRDCAAAVRVLAERAGLILTTVA
jgi:sugar phosphate isomerase/epimerase